jgi:PAS domain S-box-containing protein
MIPGRIPVARSVGGAVLLTLVCVNTLLLAVLGMVDFFGEKNRLDAALRADVATLAEQLAVNLDVPLWNLEMEHVARVVEGVMRDARVAAVVVTDRGTSRLSLGRARDQNWSIVPIVTLPALDNVVADRRDIVLGHRPIGTVEVFLTKRFAITDLNKSLTRIVLRILCLNAALALSLALVLRHQVIRPLARLEAYAARVSSGEDATPLAEGGELRGELHSLGLAMEEMVRRLQAAQRKYRDIFENATEGIFQTTLDGRVLSANAAMAEMLGYGSPENLLALVEDVGRQIFHNPEDRRRMIELLLLDGSVAGFQTRFSRRDQQVIWVLVNVRLVRDASGDPLYIEGTTSDITARLRAERRLEILNRHLREAVRERTKRLAVKASQLEAANVRLQELDRLKSGFLSTVSHDLRTPLTSIMGFAKLISRDFNKYFRPFSIGHERLAHQAERLAANLGIIESEGERLTRLINDFLDLSKIESGRAEWRDAPVDALAVIQQAVDAVSGDYQGKPEVDLVMAVPSDLPELHMDRDRLSQILVNLLGNAIKFTDRGQVRLWAAVQDRTLRLEVADTGQGVPSDSLEKIFDKFHQAEGGDTVEDGRRRKGTGLGLAICRQIVGHYGGRIWVESALGRGSTFVVELPVVGPPTATA